MRALDSEKCNMVAASAERTHVYSTLPMRDVAFEELPAFGSLLRWGDLRDPAFLRRTENVQGFLAPQSFLFAGT